MREESQLEDMRSAIRGDFERLADRGVEQELMRVSDEGAPELEPDTTAASSTEEEPRRSWLARFLSL